MYLCVVCVCVCVCVRAPVHACAWVWPRTHKYCPQTCMYVGERRLLKCSVFKAGEVTLAPGHVHSANKPYMVNITPQTTPTG